MDPFKLVSFDGKQCSAYIGYKDGKILLSAWYTFAPERDKLLQDFLDGKPPHSVPLDKFLSALGIHKTPTSEPNPPIADLVPCCRCGVLPGEFYADDGNKKGYMCPQCDGSSTGLEAFSSMVDRVEGWNRRQDEILQAMPSEERSTRLAALLADERKWANALYEELEAKTTE